MSLDKAKNIYFIGIGGIGISAIARMMIFEGKKVAGSDRSASVVTDELKKAGVEINIGHDANNIPKDCDLVIYSVAVPSDNPEFIEAQRRKIPLLTYPEALGIVSSDKFTIAVSGTSGKTTTTAMIAKILVDAGLDPTVIVGSLLLGQNINSQGQIKSNFIAGKSKPARLNGRSVGYFVVEADEYRRAFHNLKPSVFVINNITPDHLDYFKDLHDIQGAFNVVAKKVPLSGAVVCDAKDLSVAPAVDGLKCKIVDTSALADKINKIRLMVPGEHNRLNARAALAVALTLGVSEKRALDSLQNFTGTWRRFQFKGKTKHGAVVYDDYAHNPEKVNAALSGAREIFPHSKIIAIFQPHLYSRTKLLLNEFAKCFDDADELILLPIYAAREAEDKSIDSGMLAEHIVKHLSNSKIKLKNVYSVKNKAEAISMVPTDADVIITIGAGDVTEVSDLLTL